MRLLPLASTALLALAAAIPAQSFAAPITWTLDNVTATDGGQFTGSFTFDADTGIYSSALITHVPDATEPTDLTFSTIEASTSSDLNLENGPPNPDGGIGRHTLTLDFLSLLTDQGGMISVSGLATFFTGLRSETITTGTVDATAALQTVPEPAGLALLSTGLFGLSLIVRRRKAT